MRTSLLGFILVISFLSGAIAHAKGAHFIGGHPISAKHGGGYCYIDAPHMHVYGPDHPQLYQRVGDDFVFASDPTPFGYDGERHPFYGNHPVVTVGSEPVFCYIDGPHFHPFAPPDVPDYKVEKGMAFYVGVLPPSYISQRPSRRKLVNAEYRPYVALRPTVEVAPPPGWQGEVWVAPPAVTVSAPGVAVSGPGVVVSSPGVVFGPPGVVVSAPGVVFAGPRVSVSSPGVTVVGPGYAVGGGVVVEGGRRRHGHEDDDEGHGHHDRGRHNGWGKH